MRYSLLLPFTALYGCSERAYSPPSSSPFASNLVRVENEQAVDPPAVPRPFRSRADAMNGLEFVPLAVDAQLGPSDRLGTNLHVRGESDGVHSPDVEVAQVV